MMRVLLAAAALALGVAPAHAQSGSKVQEVYQRLCTGTASASPATCAAMLKDIQRSVARVPDRPIPVSQPIAAARPTGPPNWGGLDTLVGRTFKRRITTSLWMASDTTWKTHTFRWIKPGVSLEDEVMSPSYDIKIPYMIDPATNIVAGYIWDPEGYLATPGVEVDGKLTRTALKVIGGVLEEHIQVQKGGRWRTMLMGKESYDSLEAVQQRQAERSSMFNAVVGGLALGLSGAEMPAMREDGSAPNLLDTLNAANASLERKNAESKAQLDATIANAQAQAERQRREQAARAEAEAAAKRQAQAEQQARDRQVLAQTFGNARAVQEQRLAEAKASGNVQAQQYYAGEIAKNEATARQYGITNEVRQTAQQRLGQTPIGPLPAPILARSTPARPGLAADSQRFGKGEVGCHDHAGSESPFQCPDLDHGKSGSPPALGRNSGGGAKIATNGGASPPPRQGVTPGGGLAGIEYEQRKESVTLCELKGDQARFNNWTCTGSTQWTYVNLSKPNWAAGVSMTCGGTADSIRDLGTAGGYRAFGCGHALYGSDGDIPLRFGVSYVADRRTFRCQKRFTTCTP